MLHWLEVSRPKFERQTKTTLTSNVSDGKFPSIENNTKARREWNSRATMETKARANPKKGQKQEYEKSKQNYNSLQKKPARREKQGKADTELDATVKVLELHLAALQSKHNTLRRTCKEMKQRLSTSMDKCNILHRENECARNLLHHNKTLKDIHSGCEEKHYRLEDFEREFSHSEYLRPIVSLSSVSSFAAFEDDTYVHQLEDTLKRVNVGKIKELGNELSLVHILRRNRQANTISSANAENKRTELVTTCKKLEKLQHKTLKAKHLKKVAFENKANFEQYVKNNRNIWMKKINHRKSYATKLKQAREKAKRKQGGQKSAKVESAFVNSVVADFEYNVLSSRFEKLQNAICTTDLTFLSDTICETIQGTSNLNGKVSYLQEILENKNGLLKDVKAQMNSLQIHGSTDFTGTYRKVEKLEEEFQQKLHLLKKATEKETEAQKLIYTCSSYFSKLAQQLQPLKIELTNQSIAETNLDGNLDGEAVPEVIKTLQICEGKCDLLSRLEAHNFNMNEVLREQQQDSDYQIEPGNKQIRMAARRESTFVPQATIPREIRKLSTINS